MSFRFGFYNSYEGDRKYDAEDIARLFDGLITDGVFADIGNGLMTVPGGGLKVMVKDGKAWFNHTWNINDSNLFLNIPTPDVLHARYDAVILEVNQDITSRTNSIKVLQGSPAITPVKPAMTNTNTLHQYPLAYVLVRADTFEILQSDIEIAVGTNNCPFVTGIMQGINITDLFQQWNGEFFEWFNNLKTQLTDNVVTNLQGQIDNLGTSLAAKSDLVVGDIKQTYGAVDSNWLACDGTVVTSSAYPELYQKISSKITLFDFESKLKFIDYNDTIPYNHVPTEYDSIEGIIIRNYCYDENTGYHIFTVIVSMNTLRTSSASISTALGLLYSKDLNNWLLRVFQPGTVGGFNKSIDFLNYPIAINNNYITIGIVYSHVSAGYPGIGYLYSSIKNPNKTTFTIQKITDYYSNYGSALFRFNDLIYINPSGKTAYFIGCGEYIVSYSDGKMYRGLFTSTNPSSNFNYINHASINMGSSNSSNAYGNNILSYQKICFDYANQRFFIGGSILTNTNNGSGNTIIQLIYTPYSNMSNYTTLNVETIYYYNMHPADKPVYCLKIIDNYVLIGYGGRLLNQGTDNHIYTIYSVYNKTSLAKVGTYIVDDIDANLNSYNYAGMGAVCDFIKVGNDFLYITMGIKNYKSAIDANITLSQGHSIVRIYKTSNLASANRTLIFEYLSSYSDYSTNHKYAKFITKGNKVYVVFQVSGDSLISECVYTIGTPMIDSEVPSYILAKNPT